ncbi:TPA: replication protein, partial [Enterococcus faecium]
MADKKQDLINGTFKMKKKNLQKVIDFGGGRFSERTVERMASCGSYLEFIATADKEKKKLI